MSTQYEPEPRKGWWGRNWKWVVPTGCLGMIGLVVILAVVLVLVVFAGMKQAGAYQEALAAAQASPEVIAELGEPVKDGWWMAGSIEVSGPGGEANISFPIAGPKNRARVYVVAEKKAGRWEYETLEVEVKGRSERINLLAPSE